MNQLTLQPTLASCEIVWRLKVATFLYYNFAGYFSMKIVTSGLFPTSWEPDLLARSDLKSLCLLSAFYRLWKSTSL